jgi:hypothetical protein
LFDEWERGECGWTARLDMLELEPTPDLIRVGFRALLRGIREGDSPQVLSKRESPSPYRL